MILTLIVCHLILLLLMLLLKKILSVLYVILDSLIIQEIVIQIKQYLIVLWCIQNLCLAPLLISSVINAILDTAQIKDNAFKIVLQMIQIVCLVYSLRELLLVLIQLLLTQFVKYANQISLRLIMFVLHLIHLDVLNTQTMLRLNALLVIRQLIYLITY